MSEFKFFCPQCGQHILCDTGHSGSQINCPVCQKAIVVPQAPMAVPVPPQPAPIYSLPQSTEPAAGRPYPVTPVAQPAEPVQSLTLQNVLMIVVAVLVLAGLGVGGWFGYSKIEIYSQRGHYPSGLVALWPGDEKATDSVGDHNGELVGGVELEPGKVGKAFVFNGSTSYISVPALPSLDIGTGSGITIECWIKPASAATQGPLVEWDSTTTDGLQFWVQPNLVLFASVKDTAGNSHFLISTNGALNTTSWQHVALTYDKASGVALIYLNGGVVVSNNIGSVTPQTTYPLNIGRRFGQPIGLGQTYSGLIDGLGIFNRALSAAEIQAIYTSQK